MRHKNAVLAVLCLLLTQACSEFKSNKDLSPIASIQNQPLESIQAKELSSLVKSSVSPTTKPERYIVYLSWPKFEANKKLRLRLNQFQSIINSEMNTFSHEVDHNQTLQYTFDVLDENLKIEKTFSHIVKIPKDFVVSTKNNQITENQKIIAERIFLNSETPLYTNGYHLEIITNSLFSEKGVIASFPLNQKANLNNNGRSGGELQIKANSASGILNINMRGEHGGDGSNGEEFTSRAQDGAPPSVGDLDCDFGPIREPKELNSKCICLKKGQDGTNALNGENGRDGKNAGNGGNSGSLKVEIIDGTNFYLETSSEVGSPGNPGLGGSGQMGGIAQGTESSCSGKKGQNGIQGSPGHPGLPGIFGKPQLSCITIISEGKNVCF